MNWSGSARITRVGWPWDCDLLGGAHRTTIHSLKGGGFSLARSERLLDVHANFQGESVDEGHRVSIVAA